MTLSGFQEATQHMELVAWHWDIPQRNTSNKIQTLYNGLANVMTWYIKPVIMELVSQKCKKGIDREREGVEVPSQRILEFVEYWQLLRILPNYGFIWQQLQYISLMQGPLPIQTKEQPWIDCCLRGHTIFTNDNWSFLSLLRWVSWMIII